MGIKKISPPAVRLAGLFALLLPVLLAAAGCAAETAVTRPWETVWSDYPELRGKTAEETVVERVVDGDTFVTREGSRVRLIGVNTPEISGTRGVFTEKKRRLTRSACSRADGMDVQGCVGDRPIRPTAAVCFYSGRPAHVQ